MSAMGGMFAFGGGPADAGLLAALGSRLERLGPDGGREATAGSVGMAYRAFHTNAESRLERQPLAWGLNCLLTWDGRLDNREELVALLRDELRGDRTDVAIVRAAYVRWGTAAFGRIVGDFALALWDSGKRALFLARDCVGTRTLYYHIDRDRIVWSTDLGPLLDVSGVPLDVNDEYVAGFLTRGPGAGLTPYVNVHAVKPAFFLRVDVEGLVSAHRFWALDPDKEIRYRTDAEYEEHFRHLFREAVRVRLRSDRPVFAELSGGLDSSSIVCMADDILRAGEAEAPRLETVSYVFDDAPNSDERKWIGFVEDHRATPGHHITDRRAPVLVPLEDASGIWTPNWILMSSAYDLAVREEMRPYGARCLLSGHGGDHLLWSRPLPSPELADLLASGRMLSLHRRLCTWSRAVRRPYVNVLWNDACLPLLPSGIRTRLPFDRAARVPSWLGTRFVERFHLRQRMLSGPETLAFKRPSARLTGERFFLAVQQLQGRVWQEAGDADIMFPYLHRPLVEFLQAIPFDQKLRPAETRALMRRALQHVLPAPTARRRSKGRPIEALSRGLVRALPHVRLLFTDARTGRLGYVNPEQLQAAIGRSSTGAEWHLGMLFLVITLELWLRLVETRRDAAPQGIAMHGVRGSQWLAVQEGATH